MADSSSQAAHPNPNPNPRLPGGPEKVGGTQHPLALCLINCLVLFALLLAANPAFCATTARELVTPKGLRVWLIEDHSTPLLTLGFRFAGGATQDQPGKEGLAHFTAEMFLQGAGTMPVSISVAS